LDFLSPGIATTIKLQNFSRLRGTFYFAASGTFSGLLRQHEYATAAAIILREFNHHKMDARTTPFIHALAQELYCELNWLLFVFRRCV
jgi:hypothetical protein